MVGIMTLTGVVVVDRGHPADVVFPIIGAHVVGIALARYVVLVEPLASLPPEEVIDLIAPTFQRYLAEPL